MRSSALVNSLCFFDFPMTSCLVRTPFFRYRYLPFVVVYYHCSLLALPCCYSVPIWVHFVPCGCPVPWRCSFLFGSRVFFTLFLFSLLRTTCIGCRLFCVIRCDSLSPMVSIFFFGVPALPKAILSLLLLLIYII